MSSADTGTAAIVGGAVADAKAMLARALPVPAVQFDLLEEPTAEDMVVARRNLGDAASRMDVLDHARATRRGRPAGSRNRRTAEFEAWILSFGQHPSITLMKIQSTPPEVLMEASRRKVKRMNKAGELVEFEESMSYGEAVSVIRACAADLQPYLESKKPVAVHARLEGDFNLILPGLNVSEEQATAIAEGRFDDFAVDGEWADVAQTGEGGDATPGA